MMIEFLQWIFSDFWRWLGLVILVTTPLYAVAEFVKQLRRR